MATAAGRRALSSARAQRALPASYNTAMASPLIQIEPQSPPQPRPAWLRARAPFGENYHRLKQLARGLSLHTVCESARCPNLGECWHHGTATFMLLGEICTRRCGFCAVPKGRPLPLDMDEPRRVAEAVATLGLRHAVLTSVNRDDDNVGGARIFARSIEAIRQAAPGCTLEVLIPDFQGSREALEVVLAARPEILNHNTETVPELYRFVRPGARFERSLELLRRVKEIVPGMRSKTGLMLGLGETEIQIEATLRRLAETRCDILTLGQYLQPTRAHLPVKRYYAPAEFARLRQLGLQCGFRHVESGPLVRSSYHAHEQAASLQANA